MITGIRHIIFDLGGVLLNLDYSLTEKAFIQAGIADFGERYSQLQQTDIFDRLETGRMGREEFIATMQQVAATPITEQQVLGAWNAMLLDFPLRRLQILQQLRGHYDLFLLSNTNEIHEEVFNNTLMRDHGIPNIGVFFDKVYMSHRVGLRKPMPEIFRRVLEDNDLKAEHTLFIDDSPQHIATAKQVGIQTIYLEKGMTIEEHIFKPLAK
ncbi:HAD family phosphatase [Nemorincola caseinilytica]|uniref:HAD family phosphatase n=1 Tax=Nemorincola caseinilytica TaxID=2054315 RepID=A0ABP8NGD3_9BACT